MKDSERREAGQLNRWAHFIRVGDRERGVSGMEHTSKLITSTLSHSLDGQKIVLCVTGSVAAVECPSLARLLMRHGADVHVVMSPTAQRIIHPYLMEWATGNPVVTELTGQIEHVTLAGKHDDAASLVIVSPSTANTIGKIANGIDDTPVTTTVSSAIGAGIPVIVVPAMHRSLYDHPAVTENIQRLRRFGVTVLTPRMEEAKAKIPDTETILEHVLRILGPNDMQGVKAVVTAGPTRGWIDRVRFVTNPSSGKMGIEIAREISLRGGEVVLVLGPTCEKPPATVETVRVDTPEEMLSAVRDALERTEASLFVSAAAVLDFTPREREDRKRPSGEPYEVVLVPTKKIIDEVRSTHPDLFIVGFKVESGVSDEELVSRAKQKIDAGVCDLMVANDERRRGVAFGTDTNEVVIVGPEGLIKKVELAPKREVARRIVDEITSRVRS